MTAVSTQRPHSVSIIVPAYNEERSIGPVCDGLVAFVATMPAIDWEIIVVNDCSTDSTGSAARQVSGVRVIDHPQNRGYGASLKTGIAAAKGQYVLTFDADGQHLASEIPLLLDGAAEYDMTVGARPPSSSPLIRRPGKVLLTALTQLMVGSDIPDVNSGMRLIRRATILPYMTLCSNRFSFSLSSTMALMSESHFVRFLPIETRARMDHVSQVRMSAGLRALLMVFRISMVFHPLRIFIPLTIMLGTSWLASMVYDLTTDNISDLSLLLLTLASNSLIVGFLADQISHVRRELKHATTRAQG